MVLWRISRFLDLIGKGGVLYAARWHRAGRPIVYTAESSAGSLLEVCANTLEEQAPLTFTLLKIIGPDIDVEDIELSALPVDWVKQVDVTRSIGSEWLASRRSALLRVPSALVPEAWNYLLNPSHTGATAFMVERVYEYPFDLRLKG